MLKTILAFIPLISGYLFVTTWHEIRYLVRRENSQQVYFRAAFWGIWILILSVGLTSVLEKYLPTLMEWCTELIKSSFPFDKEDTNTNATFWLTSLGLTLIIGLTGGFALNWLSAFKEIKKTDLVLILGRKFLKKEKISIISEIYKFSTKSPIRRAISRLNADFELILIRSLEQSMPVSITMENKKVYVGHVAGAVNPGDNQDMLRILPLMSGYRNDTDMQILFTTFYWKAYESIKGKNLNLKETDFEIAIPIKSIQSINLFSTKAYLTLQNEKTQYPSAHNRRRRHSDAN